MDAFLILIAILASVVLLFRYAVPLAKPKPMRSERLSDSALKNRLVMLARRCAATKRGFGLYYRHVDLDKALKHLEKKVDRGDALDEWEQALYDDREEFARAFDRSLEAVRLGHALGHADGYPRLFLLCAEIVESRQGDLTGGTLDMAIDTFQAYAPLTAVERAMLPDMLVFCMCSLLCDTAHRAFKRERSYRRGIADGKAGKADLDGLTDVDYVDGLFDASDDPDKDAVARLFENNGVDRAQCEYMRAVFLAQAYGLVKVVKRSLSAVEAYKIAHVDNVSVNAKPPSKRLIVFLSVAPIVLTLVFAVLTCIFVPYEYAAVCVAAAIVFYGCFRLPLLLYAPNVRPLYDFFAHIARRVKKSGAAREKPKNIPRAYTSRADAEIAYIGCEPVYSSRSVFGGRVRAVCDNRGVIELNRAGSRRKPDRLQLIFEHDGEKTELSACDGAYDGHKYTYRAFSKFAEFAVEAVTPVDCNCCCCKITVVNRSPESIAVKIVGSLIVGCDGELPIPQISGNRIAICDDGVAVALTLGGDAECAAAYDRQSNAAFCRISAAHRAEIGGFEKFDIMLAVAYGSSVLETDSVFDRLYCDGYYEYAADCLKAFSRTDGVHNGQPPDGYCMLPEISSHSEYATPTDIDVSTDGYLPNGGFSLSRESAVYDDGYVCNTLCNGGIGMQLYQNSIGGIFRVHPYRSVTDERAEYKDTDKVCIMIGENAVLWSPTGGKNGHGHARVEHGLGHTTYFCAYNGCVCELDCRIADDADVVFFDLTVKNRVPFARRLDVMLSVLTAEKCTVSPYGNGLIARCADKSRSFALTCSERISGRAEFKESYFSHGRIVGIDKLGSDGSTPAPTVSARIKLDPYDGERVVFAVDLCKEPSMQAASTAKADEASAAERKMRRRAERLKLLSDDNALNVMHARALYKAYVGALTADGFSVPQTCATLCCVKYIDKALVRRRLIELLSGQNSDGTFGERTDGVWVVYAVADYAEFACDESIFDELVPYAPDNIYGRRETKTATVLDHALRAVDMSLLSCNAEPAFRIVYYKTLVDVLRYYKAQCGADGVRSQKYQSAIARAVNEFSISCKRFTDTGAQATDAWLAAVAMYACGKNDKAYAALKTLTERMAACPDIFGDEREAVQASVYYLLVTEKLFGVKMRGNRVKIDPHTGENAPHSEFLLRSELDGSVHVVIDDKAGSGDWRIRADKISYALNSVILGEKDNGKITLYRDAPIEE